MNALAREVLLIAKRNPNELIGRRFLLLTALKSHKQINNSVTALVGLYKAAALHPRWAKDITIHLNQHSQLHCWELSYWRFRAIRNNRLTSHAIVSEFVAHITERQFMGDEIVLLSGLVQYFG